MSVILRPWLVLFLTVLSKKKKNKAQQLKAMCCSFRRPGFDSQHPVNGSQVSVTIISVDPIPEEVILGHQVQCSQNHNIKFNK